MGRQGRDRQGGRRPWKIPAAKVRSWITFTAGNGGTLQPVIDKAAVPKALRATKKDVARTPVSAQYLRSKSGSVFGVIAGHDGRKLDTKATAAAIVAELERRAGGETPKTVKVAIARQEPKLTTEEATKKAPLMTRLGSWQTYFPISERNYFGANIWLPAQIINGTVLKPGQRFEWWSGLGPVTRRAGSASVASSPATTRIRPARWAAGCARLRRRCSMPRSAPGSRLARATTTATTSRAIPLGLDATRVNTPRQCRLRTT